MNTFHFTQKYFFYSRKKKKRVTIWKRIGEKNPKVQDRLNFNIS